MFAKITTIVFYASLGLFLLFSLPYTALIAGVAAIILAIINLQ